MKTNKKQKQSEEYEKIFKHEFDVANHAAEILEDSALKKDEWKSEYEALLKEYKALLRQAMKMTKIGDGTQQKLLKTQEELALANEKLERQAVTDALTGLYNRRYLDAKLADAFETAKRTHQPLAVSINDIDFFKKINDRFSHQTGDDVLRIVAKLLHKTVREGTTVARYGGEEFVIVFPNTDLQTAVAECEKVRKAIESYDWKTVHPELAVTISMGVCADLSHINSEKFLSAADEKLYDAKHNGRNQVRF